MNHGLKAAPSKGTSGTGSRVTFTPFLLLLLVSKTRILKIAPKNPRKMEIFILPIQQLSRSFFVRELDTNKRKDENKTKTKTWNGIMREYSIESGRIKSENNSTLNFF